ncbi:alpha/beta hydrolase fold domain-containing protein [Dyella sp. SG609]|uniref:alpha/beta hydrolase n=1 Tax=Dyella sp. SG609 TaxID=2587018 RepID=UPI0018251CB1|nr:alpha/beta hydrolase fold domain-containing protein [Dyella sp. SG609]NKJ21418.1 acetyl esterase/lipase [Dyella sp. SG609]
MKRGAFAMRTFRLACVAAALLSGANPASAQAASPATGYKADASIFIGNATVPYSVFASPESRAFFPNMLAEGDKAPPLTAPIEQNRAFYDRMNSARAARMQQIYPVKIAAGRIANVAVDVVLPAQGVAPANQARVLINLHGGAFLWGAHSGGLVEAIPIAGVGRVKVVTVDYREGPEHVFPAATDDVVAVYRELLKHYQPANVGIYGCSAGGILTGEVTARLIHDQLPLPGAIGMFCAGVTPLGGDESYIASPLNGKPIPPRSMQLGDLPYFKGASADDPLVFPANSPALLAKFPPTLLISGTRDMAMSAVIHSHTLLDRAGVEAELHVWDGMWHSFFSDPDMPESKDAYRVIWRFFDRHLGH